MTVLHLTLVACLIALRETGDGGFSSPSFLFLGGGSLLSFSMGKSGITMKMGLPYYIILTTKTETLPEYLTLQ